MSSLITLVRRPSVSGQSFGARQTPAPIESARPTEDVCRGAQACDKSAGASLGAQPYCCLRTKARHVLSEGVRGNFFFRKKEFPWFSFILCFMLFVALWCDPVFAQSFSGKVVGVADGDTIVVMHKGRRQMLRLHGIDCPEAGQAFGKRATDFTAITVFSREVTVEKRDVDRYGRTVGVVTTKDGRNLNRELVEAGMCWWYEKYAPDDAELAAAESKVKANKLGLWADPNPVPPWEFRKENGKEDPEFERPDPKVHWIETLIESGGRKQIKIEGTVGGSGRVSIGGVWMCWLSGGRQQTEKLSTKKFSLSERGGTHDFSYTITLPLEAVSWEWKLDAKNEN